MIYETAPLELVYYTKNLCLIFLYKKLIDYKKYL